MPYQIHRIIAAYTLFRKFQKLWSAYLRYYFVRYSRNPFLDLTNSRIVKSTALVMLLLFTIVFGYLRCVEAPKSEFIVLPCLVLLITLAQTSLFANLQLVGFILVCSKSFEVGFAACGSRTESEEFHLSNIVFQGIDWGPPLWNAFSVILRSFYASLVLA